jgi:hypothetical protein
MSLDMAIKSSKKNDPQKKEAYYFKFVVRSFDLLRVFEHDLFIQNSKDFGISYKNAEKYPDAQEIMHAERDKREKEYQKAQDSFKFLIDESKVSEHAFLQVLSLVGEGILALNSIIKDCEDWKAYHAKQKRSKIYKKMDEKILRLLPQLNFFPVLLNTNTSFLNRRISFINKYNIGKESALNFLCSKQINIQHVRTRSGYKGFKTHHISQLALSCLYAFRANQLLRNSFERTNGYIYPKWVKDAFKLNLKNASFDKLTDLSIRMLKHQAGLDEDFKGVIKKPDIIPPRYYGWAWADLRRELRQAFKTMLKNSSK